MKDRIPKEILSIFETVKKAGYECYFVGGSVRNMLMGKKIKDWDIATKATPEEIQKLFPDSFYENDFGTVGIPTKENGIVEITTYRSDGVYTNFRHPETVTWGKNIEEDLARRDFTTNAIALGFDNSQEVWIDPFNGRGDILERIIKAVGDPQKRFSEDALRLMRAIRFAAQLNFTIEPHTWAALRSNAKLITKISTERIRDELLKILASDLAYEGIMMLLDTGILENILPELTDGLGISQVRPGRHHTTDVFTHNVLALKYCPSTDPIVRFATLLHDVGKVKTMGHDKDGFVTFYNHEIAGAKIAREICDRLHFSKKDREKIVMLIRWHMFTVDEHITDTAVRRFIRRVGVENVKDMMDLRIGDRLGGGTQMAESWRLKKFKERIEEQLKPAPFGINDLAIDGNDIIKELNLKPGKQIGDILHQLFEEVDEDLEKNNREFLLKRIHELV